MRILAVFLAVFAVFFATPFDIQAQIKGLERCEIKGHSSKISCDSLIGLVLTPRLVQKEKQLRDWVVVEVMLVDENGDAQKHFCCLTFPVQIEPRPLDPREVDPGAEYPDEDEDEDEDSDEDEDESSDG